MTPYDYQTLINQVQKYEQIYQMGGQVMDHHIITFLDEKKYAVAVANCFRKLGYRVNLITNGVEDYDITIYYDKTNK